MIAKKSKSSKNELLKQIENFKINIPTIPLKIYIFQQCIPIFKKTLGVLYDTDEFLIIN